jgi:hypothetical protein
MLDKVIAWIFENLAFSMFILAYIFAFLTKKCCSGTSFCENIFRWVSFLPVGVTAVYVYIMNTFFNQYATKLIWWPSSSAFQIDVSLVNLVVGLTAIFAFKASVGYRRAVILATTVWLWGEAAKFIYQMNLQHSLSASNTNSWFWMAVIIPIVLIVTGCKSSKCCK